MNKKIVRMGALCVLMTTCALAQEKETNTIKNELEEVVVLDSKFALPKEKSGKIITKITAEDLAKKSGQSVATILSSVVGLEINGNQSSAGKNLGYYIRGGRGRQALIMIDGIPVTDASGINLEYDLRLIPVEQVESIEIMKGASSTLYGTGAATGVINIILKKAVKEALVGNAYMSLGTQTTADRVKYNPQDFNQGFDVKGKQNRFSYYTSLNSTETKGISEAKGDNFEGDNFSRVNALAKFGFDVNTKLSFGAFTSFDRMKNDFDSGAYTDNLENYGLTKQYRAGVNSNYKYQNGEFVITSSGSLIQRDYFNFSSLTKYKYRNTNIDAFNRYTISSKLFFVLGSQFQFFDANTESLYGAISSSLAKMNTIDTYLNAVYNSDFGLNINAGTRLDIHSAYGSNLVYSLNPSYNFKSIPLKILSSYSTAFITPSLYQLYDGYAGNLDLKAEENSTFEAGFEMKLLKNKIDFNAVAFYREENNAIEYYSNPITFEASYFNADGKYNAKGIETSIVYAINNKVKINANYTFTQTEDKMVNNTFPDIKANLNNPKHKVNLGIDYQFVNRLYIGLNYQYLDKRDSFMGYPPKVEVLDSYQLFHLTSKYELINNRLTIFASATNIFNADFVENIGYNTRGRNFKIGLNITL